MAYDRFFLTVRDQQGNAVNGASCSVYNGGTSTLALVYDPNSDDASPSNLSNPFVTTSNGRFGFMASDGEYDVVISGGNGATQQYRVTLTADAGPDAATKVDPRFTGTMYLNATSAPGTEQNTVYIKSPQFTGATAGRALNAEVHYAGSYASTAAQFAGYVEGANNQNHHYVVQSWAYGDGTGTVTKVASYMATATVNDAASLWTDYYGFYYAGVTGYGTIANITDKWCFFAHAPDPAYFSGKVAISPNRLIKAQIPYPLFVNDAFTKGAFGISLAQAGIYGTDTAAVDKGAALALGGKSGQASDPYANAFIFGGRESLASYAGYFSIFTVSGGGGGETGSANYERIRVPSVGGLQILTVGKSLGIKEGTNAKMGTATLAAGTVVVSTTAVAANSRIFLTGNADGGAPGWLRVSARTAGTSFTITSSSGTDTSTVAWVILDPL